MYNRPMMLEATRMINEATGDSVVQVFTGKDMEDINAQVLEHLIEQAELKGVEKAFGISADECESISRFIKLFDKASTKTEEDELISKFLKSANKTANVAAADEEDEDIDDDEKDDVEAKIEAFTKGFGKIIKELLPQDDEEEDDDLEDEDEEEEEPHRCSCGACQHKTEQPDVKVYTLCGRSGNNGRITSTYRDELGKLIKFIQ